METCWLGSEKFLLNDLRDVVHFSRLNVLVVYSGVVVPLREREREDD